MTPFWNWFVAVLTLASIGAIVWLLISTARTAKAEGSGGHGHVWDGDLTELNRPLPLWWLGLFLISVVFGGVYLAFYPGLGITPGALGWTSAGEVRADLAENNRKLEALLVQFRGKSVDELSTDAKALEFGHNVFVNNCAVCHGSDARGARGYPNLTDNDWLYGGSADSVLATIANGRRGAMPALGSALGEDGVTEVATYVMSLSGRKVDEQLAAAGKTRFMGVCIACHGPAGKGNTLVGAPNLTDDIWLYGGRFDDIKTSIRDGRNGQMPSWATILGSERTRLVAAWVVAQAKAAEQNVAAAPMQPALTQP